MSDAHREEVANRLAYWGRVNRVTREAAGLDAVTWARRDARERGFTHTRHGARALYCLTVASAWAYRLPAR